MYKSEGDIMICSDLNARSGPQQDFILNDEIDHVPLYDYYNIDNFSMSRQSEDSTIDARSRILNEICIGNQLRILNSRCFGDIFGQYTAAFTYYYDPAILQNKLTPLPIFRDLALRK